MFFPYLKENGIKTILHLGDLTDRRKYINYITAKNLEDQFVKVCHDEGIELHIIAGNHDCYYKNTNDVNSLNQLYSNSKYDNMNMYWNEPVELDFDGCRIMLSPWICKSNYESSMNAFRDTSAQILMGHFEISGYEMMKGQLCEDGLDRSIFQKFDAVYSGHFHHPSSHRNITYLGAPYEMNWSDCDQPRGFNIFDTSTREMTHVPNPYKIHHKILYSDEDMTIEDVAELDTSLLTNAFIKVIVREKNNPYIFDLFMDRLQQSGAADIKVVEDHQNLDIVDDTELLDEAQDTMTILRKYLDSVEVKVDKTKINKFLQELYNEAMNV